MRFVRKTASLLIFFGITIFFYRCDVYKDENKNWENKVTIYFKNLTICPVQYYLDGIKKGQIESGLDYTADDLGQGVHLLEAYPWNDTQFNCSFIYTPELKNKERYEWLLETSSSCNTCDPTPTPSPTQTPTPAATAAGTSTPIASS